MVMVGVLGALLSGPSAHADPFPLEPGPAQSIRASGFRAEVGEEGAVVVKWESEWEPAICAYRLFRAFGEDADVSLTADPLPAPPVDGDGLAFAVPDPYARGGEVQAYRLVAIGLTGQPAGERRFDVMPGPARLSKPVAVAEAKASAPVPVPLAGTGQRVRIGVERTGVYQLDSGMLAARLDGLTAGDVEQAIAEGALRLWSGSNEVAWMAAPGHAAVWFYAEAIDSIYTRRSVYWLEPGVGRTMATRAGGVPAGSAPDEAAFTQTLHAEEDKPGYYNNTVYSDPEADIWFWGYSYPPYLPNVSLPVALAAPASNAAPARLDVHLRGATRFAISPEHHARLYVNGLLVGTGDWDDFDAHTISVDVTNLVAGTNTVRIEGHKLTGEPLGTFFLVESLDLRWSSLYVAQGNELMCRGETNALVTARGFAGEGVLVLDLSDPLSPVIEDSAAVSPDPQGGYRVTFTPAGTGTPYFVSARLRTPDEVAGVSPGGWRDSTNRADYVVIAPAAFRAEAESLAGWRRLGGLSAAVVTVDEIYDAFSDGVVTPHAIRAFIAHAVQVWDGPPSFVVLAGAGTLDYRNVNNNWAVDPCLIPPMTIDTPYGLYGADNPLADVTGDRVPDVAIGRLPAVTAAELAGMVDRIKRYEGSAARRRSLMTVADNADEAGDFPGSTDFLAARVAATYPVDANYLPGQTLAQVRARLFAALDAGYAFMVYVGHANDTILADEGILKESDVAALTNHPAAPVMMAFTCLFGRFDRPSSNPAFTGGLAEQLLRRQEGGLVAVWSCVSSAINDDSVLLGARMLEAQFGRNGMRLGAAIREGLRRFREESIPSVWYVVDTYNLLGDPALDPGVRIDYGTVFRAY